jgi:hypothetical protein
MPKFTPTQQQDRSRPSARLQAQNLLESTPVLFRLPLVQLQPLPSVMDLPTAAIAQSQPLVPIESETAGPPQVSVQTQASAPAEDLRTWWEHWSSGVIVILLLVAAYLACIVALRSRNNYNKNLLATEAEFGASANIEVPAITVDSQPVADSTNVTPIVVSTPAADLANSLSSNPGTNQQNTLSLESPVEMRPQAESKQESSLAEQSIARAELLLPTHQPQSPLPLLNPQQATSNADLNAQPASTQLGQSPALYDGAQSGISSLDKTSSGQPEQNLAEFSLPDFPAAVYPQVNAQGDSAGPTLSGDSSTAAMVTTAQTTPVGLPGIPNLRQSAPASSQPATNELGESLPAISTVSTQQPVVNSQPASGLRQTHTPEANGEVESIIRAYIDLMRAGQTIQAKQLQTQSATTNRYQPTLK